MTEKNPFLHTDPIIDVRSPSEFYQGHIPGAHLLPLFSDEERAYVGTVYKKQGKDLAIKEGLRYVGPKLYSLVMEAEKIAPAKKITLYCARGGMRSSSVSWLLTTAGFSCTTVVGGYKSYRKWVFAQFIKSYSFIVIGGLTGSGKTTLLHRLHKDNQKQILDLEHLASHKGSSFGHLGQTPQPSTEHFENLLATALSKQALDQPIFLEDESRMIGTCHIPQGLWDQMQAASFLWLDESKENRALELLKEYGHHDIPSLICALERLTKRLGRENIERAVQFVQENKLKEAIYIVLDYYDKTYSYSCEKKGRKQIPINKDSLCHLL